MDHLISLDLAARTDVVMNLYVMRQSLLTARWPRETWNQYLDIPQRVRLLL